MKGHLGLAPCIPPSHDPASGVRQEPPGLWQRFGSPTEANPPFERSTGAIHSEAFRTPRSFFSPAILQASALRDGRGPPQVGLHRRQRMRQQLKVAGNLRTHVVDLAGALRARVVLVWSLSLGEFFRQRPASPFPRDVPADSGRRRLPDPG